MVPKGWREEERKLGGYEVSFGMRNVSWNWNVLLSAEMVNFLLCEFHLIGEKNHKMPYFPGFLISGCKQ